jgi:hypothetical protein
MHSLKHALLLAALGAVSLLSGCASNRAPAEVDSSLLAYVPEDERKRIDEKHTEIEAMHEEIMEAERAVVRAEDDLEVAKKEREVADATVEKARLGDEVARERSGEEHEEAGKEWEDACAYRRWVETKVALQEARVDEAEAELEHVRARHDLERCRLELMKARAIDELDRPDRPDLDVAAYESRVDRQELATGDARIAAESAEKRVELRDSVVRERAEAVPAHYKTD